MTLPSFLCVCGHARIWHDACSKCLCPYFLSVDANEDVQGLHRQDRSLYRKLETRRRRAAK